MRMRRGDSYIVLLGNTRHHTDAGRTIDLNFTFTRIEHSLDSVEGVETINTICELLMLPGGFLAIVEHHATPYCESYLHLSDGAIVTDALSVDT